MSKLKCSKCGYEIDVPHTETKEAMAQRGSGCEVDNCPFRLASLHGVQEAPRTIPGNESGTMKIIKG